MTVSNDCGRTKRDGSGDPCELPAGWGTDHTGDGACKLHGGASTGPKDTDETRMNALDHGVRADPVNLVDHLSVGERQWITDYAASWCEYAGIDYDDPRASLIKRAAVRAFQSWIADERAIDDGYEVVQPITTDAGNTVESRSEHPLSRWGDRHDRYVLSVLDKLGLLDDAGDETPRDEEELLIRLRRVRERRKEEGVA